MRHFHQLLSALGAQLSDSLYILLRMAKGDVVFVRVTRFNLATSFVKHLLFQCFNDVLDPHWALWMMTMFSSKNGEVCYFQK